MRGSPIRLTLNRADYGVVGSSNTADTWTTIVTVTVPTGLAYVLLNHTPIVFYPCTAGTTKFTARNGELAVGFKGAGDKLVRELHVWDYGSFHDLTIANQKNRNYREAVSLNMSWPFVIAREDERLFIQLYHSQVFLATAAGSVVEFDVQQIVLT